MQAGSGTLARMTGLFIVMCCYAAWLAWVKESSRQLLLVAAWAALALGAIMGVVLLLL